jgi:hypothetical protein
MYFRNDLSVLCPVIFIIDIVGIPDKKAFVANDLRAVWVVINSHFIRNTVVIIPPDVEETFIVWCISAN